jgi:hypothetical protein
MLLLICLLAGGIIFGGIGVLLCRKWAGNACDYLFAISLTLSFLLLLSFTVVLIPTTINVITVESQTARYQQKYEDLYDQAYYKMYDNDNDIGKKALADQIMEWNEDLASYEAFKKNKWVSCLYPVDIEQFKEIPITLLERTVG